MFRNCLFIWSVFILILVSSCGAIRQSTFDPTALSAEYVMKKCGKPEGIIRYEGGIETWVYPAFSDKNWYYIIKDGTVIDRQFGNAPSPTN